MDIASDSDLIVRAAAEISRPAFVGAYGGSLSRRLTPCYRMTTALPDQLMAGSSQ
jgi:hypothetical protein